MGCGKVVKIMSYISNLFISRLEEYYGRELSKESRPYYVEKMERFTDASLDMLFDAAIEKYSMIPRIAVLLELARDSELETKTHTHGFKGKQQRVPCEKCNSTGLLLYIGDFKDVDSNGGWHLDIIWRGPSNTHTSDIVFICKPSEKWPPYRFVGRCDCPNALEFQQPKNVINKFSGGSRIVV